MTNVLIPERRTSTGQPPRPLWWLERRRYRVLVASGLFAFLTLAAIGPLSKFDEAIHRPWAQIITPNRVVLLRETADKVAGQQVNTTIMIIVALAMIWRSRTWNPLFYVIGAQIGFYSIGVVKMAFSRDSTALEAGSAFFSGQFGHIQKYVMSYPSGHTSEAILMYGATYAMIRFYGRYSDRTMRILRTAWALIVINAVTMSFYLGYHWLSDLIGGLLIGWILLEILLGVGTRVPRLSLPRVLGGTAVGI